MILQDHICKFLPDWKKTSAFRNSKIYAGLEPHMPVIQSRSELHDFRAAMSTLSLQTECKFHETKSEENEVMKSHLLLIVKLFMLLLGTIVAGHKAIRLGYKLSGSKTLKEADETMDIVDSYVSYEMELVDAIFLVAVGGFLAIKFDSWPVLVPYNICERVSAGRWRFHPPHTSFFDMFIIGTAGFILVLYGVDKMRGIVSDDLEKKRRSRDKSDENSKSALEQP